jgi:hypothetical protein
MTRQSNGYSELCFLTSSFHMDDWLNRESKFSTASSTKTIVLDQASATELKPIDIGHVSVRQCKHAFSKRNFRHHLRLLGIAWFIKIHPAPVSKHYQSLFDNYHVAQPDTSFRWLFSVEINSMTVEDLIPNKRIFKDPVHDYGKCYNSDGFSRRSHLWPRLRICP